MNFVDSHCHLNDERFKDNVDEVVASSFKAGVTTILVVGYDLESSLKAIEIASRHKGVYAAIGFHPENLENVSDDNLNKIKELCKNPKTSETPKQAVLRKVGSIMVIVLQFGAILPNKITPNYRKGSRGI